MGCIKLHILDEQYYKSTELKVSYINKELTLKNSVENPRRWTLVNAIDPDGRELIYILRDEDKQTQYTYRDGSFVDWNGNKYDPTSKNADATMNKVLDAFQTIENSKDKVLIGQLNTLIDSDKKHYMEVNKGSDDTSSVKPYERSAKVSGEEERMATNGERVGTRTYYDFYDKTIDGVPKTAVTSVAHEMQHQYDYDQGKMTDATRNKIRAERPQEIRAVKNENIMRKILGLPLRTTYDGVKMKL